MNVSIWRTRLDTFMDGEIGWREYVDIRMRAHIDVFVNNRRFAFYIDPYLYMLYLLPPYLLERDQVNP